MRIEVTVRRGEREQDVAIVAPEPIGFADIAAELARVSGANTSPSWWSGELCVAPTSVIGSAGLRSGALLSPGRPARSRPAPGVLTLHQVGGRDAGRVLPLERGTIDIGRDDSCDLVLADPDASRWHARIDVSPTSLHLMDLGSTNGTFVDGVRLPADGAALHTGARIRIGDSTFEVVGPTETPAAITAAPDGTLRLLRPPRLDARIADRQIELPAPTTTSRPRGVQWVAALLPALAGGAIAWAMHSPQFLLFALLSPVMMLSNSVGDRMHWRRSRRRAAATFAQRRAAGEREITAALAAETTARRTAAPDPAAVLRTCLLPGSRLWERHRTDADLLNLRIGTGDLPSATRTRVGSVIAAAGTIPAAPVCVDLRAGPLGVAGPSDVTTSVANWLVCQVAALHSPVDVSITLLLVPSAAHRWRWARWLPHLGNVATTPDEWLGAVGDLTAVVEARGFSRSHDPNGWAGPWHLLVIDAATELGDLPGVATLLARGRGTGISAVCLEDDAAALPSACRSVVRISGETGARGSVCREAGSVESDIVLDQVSESWADAVARSLTPAVDASGTGIGAVPDSCRLLDLLGLDECGAFDELQLAQRWSASQGGADTVLGMGADGPLRIDLVGDGPHALIAGTTGAGKSELLQALVAGLAAHHPPQLLNFVLVDYKGGAAFAECAQLPHTVGLVTDLDAHLTERALRSLDSELRSRERRFAAAGVADLTAYRSVAGVEPIPRLIIAVDEFAALADELPDFIRGLVGVAQRGRSLGVHLILATQRPGGAVSAEIRANTTMRIALRVTDPAESVDVIDAADSASIERSRPGRGYLRVGSTLTCFQSARTSGRLDGRQQIRVEPLGDWRRPIPRADGDAGPTDLARLVAVVSAAAQQVRQQPARAVWMEPLPDRTPRRTLPVAEPPTQVPYGWIDLPAEQRRDVLSLDLTTGSTILAAGATGSGRSGLLASIALGCAERLSAEDLHVYVVDAAGGLAGALSVLPHCATVLGPDEVSLAPTLLRRLERVVGRSTAEPGERRARPASLLLIDNWETVVATLLDADAVECADALTALQRTGPAGRLTVVVTGDRTILAPRFAAGFDEKLLFKLADRNDFGLAGVSPRDAPRTMPPGRAVRASDGASVQIAHPGDVPGMECVRRIAQQVAAGRAILPTAPAAQFGDRDALPVRLRPLPRTIALDGLPQRRGRITLGAGGETADPICVDLFAGTGRFLIAGPPRSGRSTVLRSILEQAVRGGTHAVVAAATRSPVCSAARDFGVRVVDPADPADRIGDVPARPTLLLVDDCELYQDEPAGEALTTWVRSSAAPLAAVVAGRTEDLATNYRGLGAQIRRNNCGLLLRPGPVDGELLGVRLPRRPSSGPPGRGVLVGDPLWGPPFDEGEPVPFQAATP